MGLFRLCTNCQYRIKKLKRNLAFFLSHCQSTSGQVKYQLGEIFGAGFTTGCRVTHYLCTGRSFLLSCTESNKGYQQSFPNLYQGCIKFLL